MITNDLKNLPSFNEWKHAHKEEVTKLKIISHSTYAHLFKSCVYSQKDEVVQLTHWYCTTFKKKRKKILSQFSGPCFGLSLALIECQKNDPSFLSTFNESHYDLILQKALFFSLWDIVRAHAEISDESEKTFPPLQQLLDPLKNFDKQTILTEANAQENLSTIMATINLLKEHYLLIRMWNAFSFKETLKIKTSQWIIPHSFLIYQSQQQEKYFFYDTAHRIKIYCASSDHFSNLISQFIQLKYSRYLTSHLIWRFESQPIDSIK